AGSDRLDVRVGHTATGGDIAEIDRSEIDAEPGLARTVRGGGVQVAAREHHYVATTAGDPHLACVLDGFRRQRMRPDVLAHLRYRLRAGVLDPVIVVEHGRHIF